MYKTRLCGGPWGLKTLSFSWQYPIGFKNTYSDNPTKKKETLLYFLLCFKIKSEKKDLPKLKQIRGSDNA